VSGWWKRFFGKGFRIDGLLKKLGDWGELTPGAKAQTHFRRLNGTSKFVPFPSVESFEFFSKLLNRSSPNVAPHDA
jgi:hypothetical protein